MPHYRFYRLDRDDRIFTREDIRLGTDGEAIICAMEIADDFAIEVWQDDRKIAYIAKPQQPFGREIQIKKSRPQSED